MLVVIPAMLTDAASIDALVHRLLLHHLANPERHAQFALLTDWADADTRARPRRTTPCWQRARQASARSTRAIRSAQPARRRASSLLHRERAVQRDRAALDRLGAQARQARAADRARWPTARAGAFLDLGEASRIAADTRYVVTLDSDTQLPPGRLRELVGVAAHPQNRPRLDADGAPRGRRLRHPAAARRHAAAGAAATSRSTTGCSPASAASTRTAPPAPRSTRTCSAKAASPARACSTCRRCTRCWPAACPKARC